MQELAHEREMGRLLQWGHGSEAVETLVPSDPVPGGPGRFNGATALRPWRPPFLTVADAGLELLQWGHGSEAVETTISCRFRPVHRLLQWGHGSEAVETLPGSPHVNPGGEASMGPRL